MNRFFTLLLAASCLTAVGQSEYCLDGTVWDDGLQGCIVANPSDSNFDGCVQLNDLLDLLSAYGDCGVEESAWQCGDPLEYQGYDYETVQIGEQCWFAENLRAENYENDDEIPSGLNASQWMNSFSNAVAAVALYGEGSSECYDQSPDGNACNEAWALNEYGRLYNWYAVDDARGLCPSGWHVPTDGEWMTMEMALGMSEAEANSMGYRGSAGTQMKTDYGWRETADIDGNGTNSSGFAGLPSGGRYGNGWFGGAGSTGAWWTSSPTGYGAYFRVLSHTNGAIGRQEQTPRTGWSIRCIKDAE